MKFGRRTFLQVAAGAVGGILLSPLPWKLADDTAIWSQNWSWRPSPERGEVTKVPTICLFCAGGCGLDAHLVRADRAIYLQGSPLSPVNEGGICPLAASGCQFLYAPYRVSQPMKQTKTRGDLSGFAPISWEETITELSAALGKMRTEGKAAGLGCISGSSRSSMFDLWRQFFAAYGSPNLFSMPGHADSLKLAGRLTLGYESPPAFALERASYVLSFGADLLEGWGSPAWMQQVFGHWHENTPAARTVRLIQIEPRLSMTATKADEWISIKPGSEPALALGIAHVMITQNLYDADFVDNHVFGFENWTDSAGTVRQGFKEFVLSVYPPQKVAELSGVDAVKIEELAKTFAAQANSVAVWGNGAAEAANGIHADLTFFALNALKGNFKAGGMVSLVPTVPLAPLPEVQPDQWAQQGARQLRLDQTLAKKVPFPGNNVYAFLDAMKKGEPYSIDMLFVHEANPLFTLAETELVKNAFDKIGQIVSFSSYMDETAVQADWILPNHIALERRDDVVGLPAVPYAFYAVSSPVLPPRLDTKHTGEWLLQIAGKMGGSIKDALPWKNYDTYLQGRVAGLVTAGVGAVADKAGLQPWKLQPGQHPKINFKGDKDLWKKLTTGLCWYDAPIDPMQVLATKSEKFNLACIDLQADGLNVSEDRLYLPHHAALPPSGDDKQFPLLMMSYRLLTLSDRFLPNPPFMNKTLPNTLLSGQDLFVEVHPQTAQSLGLQEGDKAMLKTPVGEVKVRIRAYHGAHPDTVFIVQGLGHTAYDEYIRGKGVNANQVIEVQMDPVTGMGTVWATRARLVRA